MKKILSILIALTMLVSMIPTVFAEGETETETPVVSVVKEYTLGVESPGSGQVVVTLARNTAADGYFEHKIGDKSYYLNTYYHKDYGTRGWRILGVNDEMIMKASDYEGRIYRLFKDDEPRNFIQAYVGYNGKSSGAYSGTEPQVSLALALQAPEKTAFYIPVLGYGKGNGGEMEYFYIDSLSAEKDKAEDYLVDKNKVTKSSSGRLAGAVYTSTGDEIVVGVSNSTPGNKDYRFGKITFTEILEPTISLAKTSYSFNIDDGDTTNDSVVTSVTISGSILTSATASSTAVEMPVSNNYITYKSSDESVAKVSADGTITAVGKGTATISAETKDGAYKTADTTVKVTGKLAGREYSFTSEGVTTDLSTVSDCGTLGWKYLDMAAVIENNLQTHIAQFGTSANGLIFYLKTKKIESPLQFALSLEAPAKSAFYVPEADIYINNSKMNCVNWYITAPIEGKTQVEDYLLDTYKVTTTDMIKYNAPTQVSEKVIYATSEEELVSAMSAEKDDYKFFSLYLAELINPELKLTLKSSSLDVSAAPTTTASATVSGTTQEKTINRTITDKCVASGSITYKSTNEAVAKVSADGTVTAIGAGEAKIYAESKDGLVKSNEVTVTVTAPAAPEDDEELSDAFEVTEAPATGYVESTVTGLTDDSTIEAEKNSDGTFTLTAPETKENAKFLYWAKGMTNAKKIVSFDSELSNYMPEEDGKNYLIAVYEDDVSDTAEYYNANGQRIATVNEPALPSMAGYGKATGWAKYGETNIYVAEYAGKTQPDNVTVTVDGNEQTVPYGTKITCTADSTKENFKCWTKSGINGKTEIVSTSKTYSFNAWEDCTVTAIYEEHTYTGSTHKIILDTFTAGDVTAIMAEFIGLSDAVEKGIMYNGTKIAMTKPGNQFTVTADEGGTFKGYAIIGNATDGYTMITDGETTVSK